MEKIPTAEEFFSKDNGLYTVYSVKDKDGNFQSVCSYEKAVEFAKLHVEAALKEVLENVPYLASTDTVSNSQIKEAILNSYSLDNVK